MADERDPKVCPRCLHWCVYDGWGHVHGNGLGIGSCGEGDRPAGRSGWDDHDPDSATVYGEPLKDKTAGELGISGD